MESLFEFITEYSKKLTRPIKDLDDIREAMKALDMIKAEFTKIDFTLGVICFCYLFKSIPHCSFLSWCFAVFL